MNRILLAVDDAPGVEGLVSRARSFARDNHADLWVVHVLLPKGPERAPDILRELDEADRWLATLLQKKTHPERPLVVVGDPAHEIAVTAKMVGADAIIVGARPRSKPRNGDATGSQLLHLAPCPVVRLAALPTPAAVAAAGT